MGPFDMQRAFVTGGSGFLGRHLIAELLNRGVGVRALARSAASAHAVAATGAEPHLGDLDDVQALHAGVAGCDVVFHAAAIVSDWGDWDLFRRVHVTGTENLLAAATDGGVGRFVHVSTDAVLAGPAPIVRATEDMPGPTIRYGPYAVTKALAEERVLAANGPRLASVVVRPRFIWGAGDTSVLPKFVQAVQRGRFRWIDHGRYLSSTTHVRNAVGGLILAATRGRPGAVYFVTDGPPAEFRTFVTDLLGTQGVRPGNRSLPRSIAWGLASVVEGVWRTCHLTAAPPITRMAVKMLGAEVTLDDSLARRELGYVARISVADGIQEMRTATRRSDAVGS